MCESGRRLDPAVPQAAMSDEPPPKRTLVDLAEGGCARVDGAMAYYAHRD